MSLGGARAVYCETGETLGCSRRSRAPSFYEVDPMTRARKWSQFTAEDYDPPDLAGTAVYLAVLFVVLIGLSFAMPFMVLYDIAEGLYRSVTKQ